MTTIVTRLYATLDAARAAAKGLTDVKFPAKSLYVVGASAGATAASVTAELKKAGVTAATQATYASKILGGNALVVAQAPFGNVYRVTEVLDAAGPIPSGVAKEENFVSETARYMPAKLMTGARFCGNDMLLITGARMGGIGKLLMTGTRWCGNNKLLMTGTRWCGNSKLLATGTRWSGNKMLLATGSRWGGPVPLLWRGRVTYNPA